MKSKKTTTQYTTLDVTICKKLNLKVPCKKKKWGF